jgi:hypothetical protein
MINFPCPICKKLIFVIGTNRKGKKIGSCGCTWKFKKTKSAKEMDRKYVQTPTGLELRK